jgi:hypothetical protein
MVEQPKLDPAKGITEGVKAALRLVAPSGLFPTTVRMKLEEAGFDFSKQANPMASIHALLKRLEAQGYVQMGHLKDTKNAYFWVSDKPRKRKRGSAQASGNSEPEGDVPF